MAGCAGDACRGLTEPLSKRNVLCCLLKWTNSLELLGMKEGCSQVSVVFQRSDKLYRNRICSIHIDGSLPLEISDFLYSEARALCRFLPCWLAMFQASVEPLLSNRSSSFPNTPDLPATTHRALERLTRNWVVNAGLYCIADTDSAVNFE